SPEYVEKEAREQLNLVQPGDTPLVVVSPTDKELPAGAAPTAPAVRNQSLPNWQRWWNFFFAEGP
ncbi:MAG: hypothetical protein Q8P59_11530, partial [Dehalococcoidia bacterium]|nr:hypothetical protein [Dehalococcoidia bacterium]